MLQGENPMATPVIEVEGDCSQPIVAFAGIEMVGPDEEVTVV